MSSDSKNPINDLDDLITDMGELTLEGIYDLTDRKNKKIRTLNVPNLVKGLVKATLHLTGKDPSGNNVKYTSAEKKVINDFVASFNTTVGHFMDFLDYDGDHQVKLVKLEKTNGKVQLGDDLNAFLEDMKDIGSAFKTDAKSSDKIFAVLSKIFLYLMSDEFAETKEDIINFSESVKTTYEYLKALKDIDHKRVFESRVDDMISFIIMFCVLMIPIIDLVSNKLGELNTADANGVSEESEDADEIILPNDEVSNAIKIYYGEHLGTVLGLVNQLTKKMITMVESTKWDRFKAKCCCGAKSASK